MRDYDINGVGTVIKMKELVIATTNKGKLREIKDLLKDFSLKITSLADYPEAPEVIEDGKTFSQNAAKKALTIARYTGKLTLGEDSGLQVKTLGNKPGIYSARFSGENATDKKNNLKVLRSLKGVPLEDRQAAYRCYAALADHNGIVDIVNGRCSGLIGFHAKGKNGFGYDPYFIIPRYNKTFGELPPEIKAQISHRARALEKVKNILFEYMK